MKHSDSLANIAPALVKAQAEIKNSIQTADNPFYKSTYAPLDVVIDDVRPVLNRHGISVLQDVSSSGDDVIVSTMLLHVSGEWIQQEGMRLPMEKITPQGAGSAVTYGRRYTLPMMTGTATEKDDDANSCEKKQLSPQDKLKSLPQKIKDGMKVVGIDTVAKAVTFCEEQKWNETMMSNTLNAMADVHA